VFCCEEIRPGAVVCSHCGGNLAPLQMLADQHAALAVRLAALEQPIAAQRDAVRHAAAANPSFATGGSKLAKWLIFRGCGGQGRHHRTRDHTTSETLAAVILGGG